MFIFLVIVYVFATSALAYVILKSPFSYPYFTYEFDVSGKRKPNFDDYLDTFLMTGGFARILAHQKQIEQWKVDSQQHIEHCLLKKYRRTQYEQALDDDAAYKFIFIRSQTRYKQKNYVRTAYKVNVEDIRYHCNYSYIKNHYTQLLDIGFECTLREYHSKNQRRLATRKLREAIMERDDYTCQICGKYMPDEVGLQIDHIIPVSKGGKTVASNLRVLCSKCNSSKSNKTYY